MPAYGSWLLGFLKIIFGLAEVLILTNAWTNGAIVNSAHNTLLDILSRSGIFAGLFFSLILLHCIIGKYKIKTKTLLTIFLSFLMYTLMESSAIDIFVILVTILIYLPLGQEFSDEENI